MKPPSTPSSRVSEPLDLLAHSEFASQLPQQLSLRLNTGRLSRRGFMALLAAGSVAGLAGCSQNNAGSSAALRPLPDGFLPATAPTTLADADVGYSPPANFVPPTYVPPSSVEQAPSGTLGVIPRSAWTHYGARRPMLPMNGVRLITFHHTGDPHPTYNDTYAFTAAFWEATRHWQADIRHFQDIGYHFGIDRAGRVWQLRPLQWRGEHVRDGFAPPRWLDRYRQVRNSPLLPTHGRYLWNSHNIGVVSIGNFMLQDPTPQQKAKIIEFGSLLRRLYQVPIYHCYTHQELVATECPGAHLQPYMEWIRATNKL